MEFVFLAVLLMVPLFYLVMVIARLQAGAYAVSAAAREAGRAYTTATVAGAGRRPGRRLPPTSPSATRGSTGSGTVSIACDGTPCFRPDGRVEVTASLTVPLPLVPSVFAGVVPTSIPVSATHVATVDRFRQPDGVCGVRSRRRVSWPGARGPDAAWAGRRARADQRPHPRVHRGRR